MLAQWKCVLHVWNALTCCTDRSFQFAIRDTMNKWEEQTCLRFFYRTVQTDYIEFTVAEANRCACTRGYYPCCNPKFVGNNGGKRVIELGQDCNSTGIVMHLIGHTVGFWHEHTIGSHCECEQRLWCSPNPCQNGGMCIEATRVFSRDVVFWGGIAFVGRENVKNIQITNKILLSLGGKFKI